jgi:chorismate lyase/3-hydroxybenzoate synthase
LFLAGTASIVGHMSRHVGLPNEQTRETIRNVRAVLTHAKHVAGLDFTNARHRAVFKVYVRDYDSLPEIRRVIEKSLLTGDQILFLQSDLCRKELLVEIEGLILSE